MARKYLAEDVERPNERRVDSQHVSRPSPNRDFDLSRWFSDGTIEQAFCSIFSPCLLKSFETVW